jgi:hypothetical protein
LSSGLKLSNVKIRYRPTYVITGAWLLLRGGIVQSVWCTATIFWYIVRPRSVLIIPDLTTRALWHIPSETASSESEKIWRERAVNFADEISFLYSAWIFNMPWNFTTWDRRLYFPSESSYATDFIALKNPSFSAGFDPANLESNCKHDGHYTTYVIYSMEQIPSSKSNSHSTTQCTPLFLETVGLMCVSYHRSSLVCILIHLNPVYILLLRVISEGKRGT